MTPDNQTCMVYADFEYTMQDSSFGLFIGLLRTELNCVILVTLVMYEGC
jgi:hypothetical protein